jgi:hypothetical protein
MRRAGDPGAKVVTSVSEVISDCSCCGESVEGWVALHSKPETRICYGCLDWLNRRRQRHVKAGIGGWAVINVDPIFTVTNVSRTTNHYERSGFEIDHHDEIYAFARRRDSLTIHLSVTEDSAQARGPSTSIAMMQTNSPTPGAWPGSRWYGPHDFDYGKREGAHTDPDGNVIRFGSPRPQGSA